MLSIRLALANLRSRLTRTILTVTAVALAVSLVVAVTSGYTSISEAAQKFLGMFMGSIDAQVSRAGGGVTMDVLSLIEADPRVRRADPRLEVNSTLLDRQGNTITGQSITGGLRAELVGIRRPQDTRVDQLMLTAGSWFDTADANVAVIDQAAAELLDVTVGDTFSLPGFDGPLTVRVVGQIHKPTVLAHQQPTIYLPLTTMQAHLQDDTTPRRITRILVDLNTGVDTADWAAGWASRLEVVDPQLRVRTALENRQKLDDNMQGLEVMSYLGGTVSMLAATFIVFSTLSMGVAERQRTLAMLRAVGALRGQVATTVLVEGVAIAAIGVAIGIPLGLAWVALLAWRYSDFLTSGVIPSYGGIAMGGIGSIAAALLASLLPAWSAMRVSPLEAMTPLARPGRSSLSPATIVAGLLLLTIDPIVLLVPTAPAFAALGVSDPGLYDRSFRFFAHFLLGIPALFLGFFLLSPAFVWIVERAAGPLTARLCGLQPALLRQQLSGGGLWRAAGTASALMVGLAILVVMQVQGTSALSSWQLPTRFPDIFIISPLGEVGERDIQRIAALPELRRDESGEAELLPVAVATPQFGSGMFALIGAAVVPDATMFFGMPIDRMFDMIELNYTDGSPEQARELLKKGRHILVTEEFRQLKGLGVGDTMPLRTRRGMVDYTIAGVVWSPGMDVLNSRFDMGQQFEQRTAYSVFGRYQDAVDDFGATGARLFAANLSTAIQRDEMLERVKQEVGKFGLKAGDVREIKSQITSGFYRLLALMSSVAVAAMAVSSLGVANTIMAAIRTRRWQLGILRSIGTTRGQLLRLVLAESVLLGTVGAMLGLSAGAIMTANARLFSLKMIGFLPPLTVPWVVLLVAAGAVVLISLAASIWPAVSTARTQPLTLLQAGRSAA